CAGTNGIPLLQSSLPRIGTTVQLSCQQIVPMQLTMIAWGFSSTDWNGVPLPLDLSVIGMTGCTLRVRPDFIAGGMNPAFMFAGLSIPNLPAWVGAQIHAQAISFDPPANPFGAVLSNAL